MWLRHCSVMLPEILIIQGNSWSEHAFFGSLSWQLENWLGIEQFNYIILHLNFNFENCSGLNFEPLGYVFVESKDWLCWYLDFSFKNATLGKALWLIVIHSLWSDWSFDEEMASINFAIAKNLFWEVYYPLLSFLFDISCSDTFWMRCSVYNNASFWSDCQQILGTLTFSFSWTYIAWMLPWRYCL